jgi:chaperonin GroES
MREKVLVVVEKSKDVSSGGIILPDITKEKPSIGKVVCLGKLKEDIIKVGDRVLFGKYDGLDISIDNKEYVVLNEDSIIAIFA